MNQASYGTHLTLDGNGGSRMALFDLALIYRFLDELPAIIGMTRIMPPYVFRYKAPAATDSGISGVVLIAESHISIHTYPWHHYLSMDVFSCKDFDEGKAVDLA